MKIVMNTETVTVENTYEEIMVRYMASKSNGKFSGRILVDNDFARGTFEREGSRIEVCVTRIEGFYTNTHYIVSVPNFFYSSEHENSLNSVAYKMNEKSDWSRVDCESVQMAAVSLLKMMNEYKSGVGFNYELV